MPIHKIKLVCFVMISLLAYTNFTLAAMQNENIIKIKTIVIDAGHGGKDAGAVSKNGIYKEKDIALSIALKFGAKIKEKYPDIKVIYTRDTDRYIELGERAAIANRNKADLFISIHINSTKGTVATGTETFVMGTNKSQSNFEICKTENSVIVLEDDYQSKYEGFDPNSPESYIIFSLLQNTHLEQSLKFASYIQDNYRNGPIKIDRGVKQGGLLVLWKATMPAVLTEVGFISNSEECMMLTWDQTQNMIASRLLDAFSSYKNDYESFQGVRTSKTADSSANNRSDEVTTLRVAAEKKALEEKRAAANKRAVEEQITFEEKKAEVNREVGAVMANSEKKFRIQILSVPVKLKANAPDLKGREEAYCIYLNNTYKYCIGEYNSREEAEKALPSIGKLFKGAFIIFVER
jgi:N-acetylmuramoyl-L-alanine amidase